jgi:phosphoserine phosphatase
MAKRLVPMAIAYDFDGTLADGNMQEHQFLPDIGMKPAAFWSEVKRLTREHQADEVLVYMNLMLRKAAAVGVPVRRDDFKARGKAIQLFDGVTEWFDRITVYGRSKGVRIEHFLISSGNAEIFAGTPIASKFRHVYASKFMFDENGAAAWPALAVNYTTKTQYLFRINKDAHDLADNSKVNQYVEKRDRPVPFENIVFIGDGSTDIPCFRLVKEQGGLSIAVFKPRTKGAQSKASKYLKEGRVQAVVPANYTEGADLDRIVKANIDAVAARAGLLDLLAEEAP